MDAESRWRWVGDRALLRRFPEGDLATANRAARALHRALLERRTAQIEDVIPGARSVLVLLRPGVAPPESVLRDAEENAASRELGTLPPFWSNERRLSVSGARPSFDRNGGNVPSACPSDVGEIRDPVVHEVDVGYGGADGVDLAEVARLHGLSERDVVALHSSVVYTVGFLGFSPGFAYLLGLPPTIATPRLATPRTRVPAGSVAIGGEFTAVYPQTTPGGWRLIGRTSMPLFDASSDPPARLAPGDRVRFVPR